MITITHKNSKESFNKFPVYYKHYSIYGYITLGIDEVNEFSVIFNHVNDNEIIFEDISDEFIINIK